MTYRWRVATGLWLLTAATGIEAQPTGKPVASTAAPQATAPLSAARAARLQPPGGNVRLVDRAIARDKYEGFFQLYVQQLDASEQTSRWSFQPLPIDRTLGSGTVAFPAAGVWSRWSADCAAKRLTITDIIWVAQDGRTLPTGSGPASRLDPASGWTRPTVVSAAAMQEDICPADLESVLLSSVKSGLSPRQYPSAVEVVRQARQVRTPSSTTRTRSMYCEALAREADRLSNSAVLRTGSISSSFAAKGLTLQRLAALVATGRTQAESDAARASAKPVVDRALATKNAVELARELDKCLTDLPLGAMPGAFSALVR